MSAGVRSEESRARQAEEIRSLRYGHKSYTADQISRMFRMRDDGHSNVEIGERFGLNPKRLVKLIGRRVSE